MPVILQGTVSFEPAFLARLPALESAMLAQDLDPSAFVISKDRATPATVPWIGPFFWDYTVFVDDEHFTVTEPNDMRFLAFLLDRIAADDSAAVEPAPPFKLPKLLGRFVNWMSQPI
jgi:hypothetical protein